MEKEKIKECPHCWRKFKRHLKKCPYCGYEIREIPEKKKLFGKLFRR